MAFFNEKTEDVEIEYSNITLNKCDKYFKEKCLTGLAKTGELSDCLDSEQWNLDEIAYVFHKTSDAICDGDRLRSERVNAEKSYKALIQDYMIVKYYVVVKDEKEKMAKLANKNINNIFRR